MRTTVRIDDDLLRQAKKVAAQEGRTLTSLIEEALTIVVNKPPKPLGQKQQFSVPVSKACGRLLPGVDIDNNAALEDILNDR